MRILGLVLLGGVGCAGRGPTSEKETVLLEEGSIEASLLGDAPTFAVVSGTTTGAAEITVSASAPGVPDVVGPDPVRADGAFSVPLRGLRGDTTYTVRVHAESEDGGDELATQLTTGTLDGEPPALTLAVDDPAFDSGFVAVMYETVGDLSKGIALYDVDGGIVWSWSSPPEEGGIHYFEPMADGSGLFVLFVDAMHPEEAHGRVIGWDGEPVWDIPVPDAHHSATLKVPGTAFATVVHVEREIEGFGERCHTDSDIVTGDAIVEVAEDGTRTEVWNAFDDMPLDCHAADGQDNDWTHLNAIDYDPATDRYMVSEYWLGVVRVIDRATRETVYTLGAADDADCPADIAHQHAADFTPDGISLYDNGHDPARMLRYVVDFDAGTCAIAEAYEHPDGLTALALGDLDVTDDGRWFTAWGDGGDVIVVSEGDLATTGDAYALWHATVPSEYEADHGGTIVGSIAFVPTLYDIDLAR